MWISRLEAGTTPRYVHACLKTIMQMSYSEFIISGSFGFDGGDIAKCNRTLNNNNCKWSIIFLFIVFISKSFLFVLTSAAVVPWHLARVVKLMLLLNVYNQQSRFVRRCAGTRLATHRWKVHYTSSFVIISRGIS